MAADLAEHAVPGLEADTAAVAPGGAITPEAAMVIKDRTGQDRSDHIATDVTNRDPNGYDAVIAMDRWIAQEVIAWVQPDTPMFVWNVPDPYLRGLEVYEATADTIETLVQATFLHDGSPKQLWSGVRPDADAVTKLKANLVRWRKAVHDGASPSHCNGMATSAARDLERLLKSLLEARLKATEMSLQETLAAVRYAGHAQEVRTLPLGTVVTALAWVAKHDPVLKAPWRAGAGAAGQQFVVLRNKEIHDAVDVALGTLRVLDAIEAMIADRSFRSLLRGEPVT